MTQLDWVRRLGLGALGLVAGFLMTLGGALTAPLAAYACRRLPPRMLIFGVGLALICLNVGVVLSWVR